MEVVFAIMFTHWHEWWSENHMCSQSNNQCVFFPLDPATKE